MRPALLLLIAHAAFASPQDCAPCHRAETASFAHAGMANALQSGRNSAILKANPSLTATIGGYSYQIAQSFYMVTDGKETIRVPIDWAFGQGATGQTYLFQRNGQWYESRVSYFSALKGLDVTLGQDTIQPLNLLEAAGRAIDTEEARKCFDCHATNVRKPLDLAAMSEGVQCERCHGDSAAHLQTHAPMKKLGGPTTEEMSEFCGQCHRTWSQVASNGPRGILNVRFQPYRLGSSKCYDPADKRIRCTACHDPHRDLETSARAYDGKCLACHTGPAAHTCKVATKDCVTCHMPKLELPGAHKNFTDHWIRVVKRSQPYPD